MAAGHGDSNAAANRDLTSVEISPEEHRKAQARAAQLEQQSEF